MFVPCRQNDQLSIKKLGLNTTLGVFPPGFHWGCLLSRKAADLPKHGHQKSLKEIKVQLAWVCILCPDNRNHMAFTMTLTFPRIKHENIVTLEDIYESSTHYYLVMQL